MYYAGIGSRETPAEIGLVMTRLGIEMQQIGWTLRSGGARGADTFFEGGVDYRNREIFIHKDYVNGHRHNPSRNVFNAARFDKWEEAMRIASEIHPRWHKCNDDARGLHARNIFQILGEAMDPATFSRLVVCWAIPDIHGVPEGGTRTAWKVAEIHNIPRYNLAIKDDRDRIKEWLESRQTV